MEECGYSQSSFHLMCGQTFWQHLAQKKLSEWKLSECGHDVYARFSPKELSKNKNILQLDSYSFSPQSQQQSGKLEVAVKGQVVVLNRREDLNTYDYSSANAHLLLNKEYRFQLVCHVDLKTHQFGYRLVMPQCQVELNSLIGSKHELDSQEQASLQGFIEGLVQGHNQVGQVYPYQEGWVIFDAQPKQNNFNMSVVTSLVQIGQCSSVIVVKDEIIIGQPIVLSRSQRVSTCGVGSVSPCDLYPQIKQLDLRQFLDQKMIATNAVNLNISLMKWRIVPDLDIPAIQQLKVLLIGAGTLGCQLSRNLLGWGITHLTLLDNGHVSFSNPVRQSLFRFSDSEQALPKAETAAERLKEIYPNVNATGVKAAVPMPGHWQRYSSEQDLLDQAHLLEQLIMSHDVVYLLTDNRESRWLPTVLAQKHNKICFAVALGFDSYVVIRHGNYRQLQHGPVDSLSPEDRHGCYFCNDVVAPTDSMTDRTLDQQCTVTRPGVAYLAAGLACEVLVSLSSHPLGKYAPGMDMSSNDQQHQQGYLGYVPQYLRGNVYDYQLQNMNSKSYSSCVACSPPIINKSAHLASFLPDVIRNPDLLQDLSGITAQIQQIDFEKDFIAID